MRGLLGDRFLRRFSGDLKHRHKRPDKPASVEDREEVAPDASTADTNDVPIKAEPNKQNEIEPRAD